jgi:hypothetical protein
MKNCCEQILRGDQSQQVQSLDTLFEVQDMINRQS